MPIPSSLLESPFALRAMATPASVGTGPIVVATAGAEDADAAVRLAWKLAGRTNADVQVITALEPVAPVDVQFTMMPPIVGELRAAQRDAQLAMVRTQMRRALPPECSWPLAAVDGPASDAIARWAGDQGARLVLVGRGRHGVLGRLVIGETVLRILRQADVPVYAVESDVAELPRRIVVAVDFSPYSIYAARVALSLAAPNAVVTLVHVPPRPSLPLPQVLPWQQTYVEALPALFERACEALGAPGDVTVETATLAAGAPGHGVIEYATAVGADLVVSGTHGYGFVDRLVLGSVASELLRGAPCSFLCVPGSATTRAEAREVATARLERTSVSSGDWEQAARDLTARNTGRACTLLLVEPGIGARSEVRGLPLAGIDYEPATRAVSFMFGAARAGAPHLTHTVRDVQGMDRLRDAAGADRAVRVVAAEGEVEVEFG